MSADNVNEMIPNEKQLRSQKEKQSICYKDFLKFFYPSMKKIKSGYLSSSNLIMRLREQLLEIPLLWERT